MCQNHPDVGNIIPITRLRPDCFTFCKTCHVISLYWYFKNCQLKMYCECWNTQLFTTFKWEQILQTNSHIMMKSQHNSVLHEFSVADWSEMCRVVNVYRPPDKFRYPVGESVKMWCQEFDIYLSCWQYGFSISVQPEITSLSMFFSISKIMFFQSWQVCD